MSDSAEAFGKGGCGCILAFFVVAGLAVMCGGSAHIDLGGLVILFVIGGILGLIALGIYNRGRRDRDGGPRHRPRHRARRRRRRPSPGGGWDDASYDDRDGGRDDDRDGGREDDRDGGP